MNRFCTAAFAAAALLVSPCAFAQTTAAPATTSQQTFTYTAMVTGGATFTKKSGGFIGGEISRQFWPGVEIGIEGGWMSTVVNTQSLDAAQAIANYLAQSQGQAASATVKMPAGYGAVNLRYAVYTKERYNVYVIGGAGFAVRSPESSFTIGGTNVGSSVAQYGVTLGKDLAGSSTGALVNVGGGVTIPHGVWIADVGYRFTPMFGNNATSAVSRIFFGFGRRF